MSQIIISNVNGLSPNYDVYTCDVYGGNCVFLATLTNTIPPPITLNLPPSFNTVPAVGLKIITSDGCERFHILYCQNFDPLKRFQTGVQFYFMDGDNYEFQ
jgi:hypothetical protein